MNLFFTDVRRYQAYSRRNMLIHLVTQRGLWAIFQYRVANRVYRSRLPSLIKKPILFTLLFWRIFIETVTGITLPHTCSIGKGLYIGHAGNIILNAMVTIGDYCNLSQGVTIGLSGRADNRGVPVIGNYVYLAANAVVVGKIKIGDGAVIGANSVVTRDVAPGTTVMGVPAQKISGNNSDDYILPIQ